MYQYRKTIQCAIQDQGITIHSGVASTLKLFPAPSGTGICFRRSGSVYPLHPCYIEIKNFHTVLRFSSTFCVQTVEHVLAACLGLGVTDIIIECSQEELPFFDGSALHFSSMLHAAGLKEFKEESEYLVLQEPISVSEGNSYITLTPGLPFIHVSVPLTSIYQEEANFSFLKDDFYRNIAPARTFSQLSKIELMRQKGLIQGGNLECAVVLQEDGTTINPEGFRLPQECARHKILDILGDFMTLGAPCIASIESYAPGHSRNLKAVQCIAKNADSYRRMKYSDVKKYIQAVSEKKSFKYAS
ncbi:MULTISPECIES: UDP-3-O-acyl-N-acetylglucosamine deacetylase [Holospora]|uniref:UDP-3-O-acyl-N-acetylglucosamine deacetylase n=2 Tax=Holospora TaxID=44747 RepID=A0A061JH36_9PROT|nr:MULTISPECIES: UDP-3-O-acyl-N-acetylglucosamine deacetylase [Holospora]ETZ05445.1 UDP-3-O-[3-hydroxymyristoyl] N-acetylglucosamine deacetylase [Holospora undulata HU1]GAJ46395.1 UDP-3-O-[3-hydroxymyristoyl] N-acetylglucosamine deacetylase [Holospora elegans E1]